MKKILAILPVFCFCLSSVQASDWISRFDYRPKSSSSIYKPMPIELPQPEEYAEASIDDYNSAVSLNNKAIDEINSNNTKEAVSLLKEAVNKAPGTINFRRNYLIALNKANQTNTLIEEAKKVLSMDPNDHNTAYLIGLTYLNDIKDYETAADYFTYAIQKSPDDSTYILPLITSLDNTGKYGDTVFELLEHNAKKINEAYPYYLLGLKYMDRGNYSDALKAFASSKKLDNKGYAYHAYVRCAFYGGKLEGLEEIAKNAINKFPNDKNINSTKRIYNSLKDSEFSMREHIVLKVSGASSLEELNFNIRPIADFQNHQKVKVLSCELISKGKKITVTPVVWSDGTLIINVPKNMWSPEIVLEIRYHINMKKMCESYFGFGDSPDIEKLKQDPKLSLEDSRLDELVLFIDNLTLDDSDSLDGYRDIFITKASSAVSKGLNYLENGVDNSVSWALDNLDKCDCTEYSRLLTAICLKKGIPARLATGFLVKSELINKETPIGHEWCEVYIDGKGWTPIDATLQSTMHRAYSKNMLCDQIFFEYPKEHEKTRISVDYTARNSDVKVSIENNYKVYNLK